MTTKFIVTVEIPEGMTQAEMASYIKEAVRCWAGSKDPDSAIFDLNRKSVKVTKHETVQLLDGQAASESIVEDWMRTHMVGYINECGGREEAVSYMVDDANGECNTNLTADHLRAIAKNVLGI